MNTHIAIMIILYGTKDNTNGVYVAGRRNEGMEGGFVGTSP